MPPTFSSLSWTIGKGIGPEDNDGAAVCARSVPRPTANTPQTLGKFLHRTSRLLFPHLHFPGGSTTPPLTSGVNEYGVEMPFNGLEGVRERRRRDNPHDARDPRPHRRVCRCARTRTDLYEATISQVYTLCSLGSLVKSGQGEFVDALVRVRIFWYGHIHEGIMGGLRGGRLIL
jgi:hypothetical protein